MGSLVRWRPCRWAACEGAEIDRRCVCSFELGSAPPYSCTATLPFVNQRTMSQLALTDPFAIEWHLDRGRGDAVCGAGYGNGDEKERSSVCEIVHQLVRLARK